MLHGHLDHDILGQGFDDGMFDQSNILYVAKWRGVSYGFFLQTVNNADKNDGYWEAIRLSPLQDINEYV
eukprot:scaffold2015_cov186-Amphora_coffeaeformis.AAC.2